MLLLAVVPLGFAQGTPVDLNTWIEESPPGNGNWVVATDGSNVIQTINDDQTFFVSPNTFFNTSVNGQFGQEQAGGFNDDDYFGFVFGYQTPNSGTTNGEWDFLVFDWKQGNQSGSTQGFTLAKVDGATCTNECIPFGNHQTSQSGSDWTYEVLATNVGTGLGWVDNVVYDFELLYEENRIRITITGGTGTFQNGLVVFDVMATPSEPLGSLTSFPSGRFGFYNYSQANVRYASFIQNNGPTAVTDEPTVDEDDSVTFNVLDNDTDPNMDPLSVSGFTQPSNGTLTDNGGGSFTYEPDDNFCGDDSFTYTVTDGEFSDEGDVEITIDPVNDDPAITTLSGDQSGDEGTTFSYMASATDLDAASGCGASTLTYTWNFGDGSPGQSGVDLTSVNHVYTTAGTYTLTLTVTDGGGGSDMASLTVTVNEPDPGNTPPEITSLTGDQTGDEGTVFNYMASATDVDGDPLTYTWNYGDGSPEDVGLDLTMVSHVYASDGVYTLTLTVSDGQGGSDMASLTVTVNDTDPPGDDPNITITVTPVDPPIVIERGDRLVFDVTVTNNEATMQIVDVWAEVMLPGGATTTPGFGVPIETRLRPGQSRTRRVDRRWLRQGPDGLYTFRFFVGEFSDVVYDQDSFTFTVTSGVRMAAHTLSGAPVFGPGQFAHGSREAVVRIPTQTPDGRVAVVEVLRSDLEALLSVDMGRDIATSEAATDAVTANAEGQGVPATFAVHGSYPNPFNPMARIAYDLAETSRVTITVYDVRGRQVAVLMDGEQQAGRHTALFDASALPSGLYLARVVAGEESATVRMLLAK